MNKTEHDFHHACKKVGIKDPSRLKHSFKHYLAVFVEMTKNGTKRIKVKEYHQAVGGGEYRVAKAAFDLFNSSDEKQDQVSVPPPQWFQQFVAGTAGFAQGLWQDISTEIQREVEERVQLAEAAKNVAEKNRLEIEDYFEEINAEKEALEVTVQELAGYRVRNEELHHELKDLARENSHIEGKLGDVVEDANALRLQMSELQSLKIQVAKFEAELELKTQQIIDYRTMLELFESSKTVSKDTENLSEHDLNVEECEA
ncbi:hypothetical protein [Vibrio cortegadensis]|uniref:hypothetical protein n=1 Tax=Vibrio cortegadensis TaxID=1328770 RepID=UPI00352F772C